MTERDPDEWIPVILWTGIMLGALMWWGFMLWKEVKGG